jgi:hypothetical protein
MLPFVQLSRFVRPFGFVVAALMCLLAISVLATGADAAKKKKHVSSPTAIDPDILAKSAADASWSLEWVAPGKYRLLVQSTSGDGFIDSFDWVAGPGFTITKVTASSSGSCAVKGDTIACVGHLQPPKCTCLPGGSMTIDFTATGDQVKDPKGVVNNYGEAGSYIAIKTITPVPYHIPSSLDTPTADFPICAAGQKSTKSKPCANP